MSTSGGVGGRGQQCPLLPDLGVDDGHSIEARPMGFWEAVDVSSLPKI